MFIYKLIQEEQILLHEVNHSLKKLKIDVLRMALSRLRFH